jgi:hypothetical protein
MTADILILLEEKLISIFVIIIQELHNSLDNCFHDPETLLTGVLSYGAIFSIIDGTNCCPKAFLACRSVNLVFTSIVFYVVILCVFMFCLPCCDVNYNFFVFFSSCVPYVASYSGLSIFD